MHMNFLILTLCARSVCRALEAYAIGKILLTLHKEIAEIRVPKTEIWCPIWFVFPHVLAVTLHCYCTVKLQTIWTNISVEQSMQNNPGFSNYDAAKVNAKVNRLNLLQRKHVYRCPFCWS